MAPDGNSPARTEKSEATADVPCEPGGRRAHLARDERASFEVWNVGDFSRLAAVSPLQTLIGLALAVILKAIFREKAM